MRGKRPRLSLGTVLTICLTAAVIVGCVFLLSKIRSTHPDARMDAQKVIGLVGDALHGTSPTPGPQSTVKTVMVTLMPTAASTPAPAGGGQRPPEETAPRQERETYTFSLTVAGLMNLHSDISYAAYDRTGKTFDYRPIFSQIAPKLYADLNLVTLPQGINAADEKYSDALVPAAALDAVRGAGFDDVLLNTERALDQGAQGAVDTVSALAGRGFSCGGVTAGSASQHQHLQLNGARIAILSYTCFLTGKGKTVLESQPGLLTVFDLETARQDILAARREGADCVIVCLYWGRADATAITAEQRERARALAEMGADVILGTRPSRVLPMELFTFTGADGQSRQALAVYSLGTLLTESREGYDISGMLLHLTVSCQNGEVTFPSIEYTPTYIWRQSMDGKMQYRVVCSADPAPAGMEARQQEVMARALERIQNLLQDGPAVQRK